MQYTGIECFFDIIRVLSNAKLRKLPGASPPGPPAQALPLVIAYRAFCRIKFILINCYMGNFLHSKMRGGHDFSNNTKGG